jgi:adenylate kinase family enzyme
MPEVAAVLIIGAPGAGKSAVAEALSTLLTESDVPHGALELEQLAWGHPWLIFADALDQLPGVLAAQRRLGRSLFLIAATPETAEELDALVATVGSDGVLVVALRADPDTLAARVLRREPEHWGGRFALAEHARSLANIPDFSGVDLVLETASRLPMEVARVIAAKMEGRDGASG